MRRTFVCLGSLASGGLAILLGLISLWLGLIVSGNRYIGLGGWDPIATFGRYWELAAFGITVLVFGLGCSVGLWFFNKRLSRDARESAAGN